MSFFDNKYLAITIGNVEFDISKSSRKTSTGDTENILMAVIKSVDNSGFDLTTDLLEGVFPHIGETLSSQQLSLPQLHLNDLLAVRSETVNKAGATTKTDYLFSATFGAEMSLVDLPILKNFIPQDFTFSIHGCQLTWGSRDFTNPETSCFSGILPEGVVPLPAIIKQGINISASITIGDSNWLLETKTAPANASTAAGSAAGTGDANASAHAKGFTPVNKSIGPVNIAAIGLSVKNGNVQLTLTGGLKVGPLALEFIGFEISTPLDQFDPQVSLEGMGIDVNNPPLTIGGMFVKTHVTLPGSPGQPAGGDASTSIEGYDGSLVIGYNNYSLTAFGSFAKLNDGKSTFFLYGFLGAPLGGPPVCFVTGVAAGFGFNRSLTLPTGDTLSTHPLVAPVISGSPVSFDNMNLAFPVVEGAYWGAVGIRAESFKMVESFILLVIQFYKTLEIDLIGTSTMTFPIPAPGDSNPPLARIGIGLVARIIPEEGIVSVNGAFLPGSYVLNPMASISGGFAMLSIFKDQDSGDFQGASAGDFVLTLGGYASTYVPQSYYPRVSRLELNWQVSDDLSVKAAAYFAITPQALMAGGYLQAHFNSGGDFSIRVFFKVGADFIIYWKPYHYLGDMYADLSVTATLSIPLLFFTLHVSVDFDLGADLTIWGPSFSGNASIHVHVLISFTVSVSFGDAQQNAAPISWSEFSKGFLPDKDKVISTNIVSGLIPGQSNPKEGIQVVNKKELVFTCSSAIPLRNIVGVNAPALPNTGFGIKPMANTTSDFSTSSLVIKIDWNGVTLDPETIAEHFRVELMTRNMPAALWEPAQTSGIIPDNNGDALITNLTNGVKLSAQAPAPGTSYKVPSQKVDFIAMRPAQSVACFSYSSHYTKN